MAAIEVELTQVGARSAGGKAPAVLIGELYERHHRMVRSLCQLLLRNPTEAEDAAQQTFLSAYKNLLSGSRPERPAPWLAMIARRECWARTEARMRQPLLVEDFGETGAAADAFSDAIRNADLSALWQAINALPRQQRKVFLMREFSGLSYEEVAEALGASESAVESLLVRARKQLREQLTPVLRAANAALTLPIILRSQLRRLLSSQGGATVASGGKLAALPATIKVGAAAVSVALVAGSVTVGVRDRRAFDGSGPSGRSQASPAGRQPVAGSFATGGSKPASISLSRWLLQLRDGSRDASSGFQGASATEAPTGSGSSDGAGQGASAPSGAPSGDAAPQQGGSGSGAAGSSAAQPGEPSGAGGGGAPETDAPTGFSDASSGDSPSGAVPGSSGAPTADTGSADASSPDAASADAGVTWPSTEPLGVPSDSAP